MLNKPNLKANEIDKPANIIGVIFINTWEMELFLENPEVMRTDNPRKQFSGSLISMTINPASNPIKTQMTLDAIALVAPKENSHETPLAIGTQTYLSPFQIFLPSLTKKGLKILTKNEHMAFQILEKKFLILSISIHLSFLVFLPQTYKDQFLGL